MPRDFTEIVGNIYAGVEKKEARRMSYREVFNKKKIAQELVNLLYEKIPLSQEPPPSLPPSPPIITSRHSKRRKKLQKKREKVRSYLHSLSYRDRILMYSGIPLMAPYLLKSQINNNDRENDITSKKLEKKRKYIEKMRSSKKIKTQ